MTTPSTTVPQDGPPPHDPSVGVDGGADIATHQAPSNDEAAAFSSHGQDGAPTIDAADAKYRYRVAVGCAIMCGACFSIAPGIVPIYLPFYGRMKDCAGYTVRAFCLDATNAGCEWVDESCRFSDWRVVDCPAYTGDPDACVVEGLKDAPISPRESGSSVCSYDYKAQTCAHVAGYDDTRTGVYAAASTALGAVVPLAIDAVRKRHGLPTAFATCAAVALLSSLLATWSLSTDAYAVMIAARLIYGGIAYALMSLGVSYAEVAAPEATSAASTSLNFSINVSFLLLDAYGLYSPNLTGNYASLMEGLHDIQWLVTAGLILVLPVISRVLDQPPPPPPLATITITSPDSGIASSPAAPAVIVSVPASAATDAAPLVVVPGRDNNSGIDSGAVAVAAPVASPLPIKASTVETAAAPPAAPATTTTSTTPASPSLIKASTVEPAACPAAAAAAAASDHSPAPTSGESGFSATQQEEASGLRHGDDNEEDDTGVNEADENASFMDDLRVLVTRYRKPFLRGMLLSTLENGCGIAAVTSFAPILLESSGFDPMQGNFLCGVAYVIGSIISLPVERHFPLRTRAFTAAFTMSGASWIIGFSLIPPVDLGHVTVLGLSAWIFTFAGIYAPAFFYCSAKLFPPRYQATASAMMIMGTAFWTLLVSAAFPSVVTALSGGEAGDKRWGRGLAFVMFGVVGTILSVTLVKTFKTWDEVVAEAREEREKSDRLDSL